MTPQLPEKITKLMAQVAEMILPAAIKAAGPVLVTFNRTDDGPSDKQALFSHHFSQSLNDLFIQLAEKPLVKPSSETRRSSAAKNSQDDLEERISKYSLMDTDLLEAQLAAERISTSLETEFQFPIDCTSMRLEKLLGLVFEREKNPLQAKNLTLLFRQSCDQLLPSKNASDIAMKNWGEILKKAYPEWLESVNNTLIQQRVLPNLDKDDVQVRYQKKDQEKAREMRKNLISEITGTPQNADKEITDDDLMRSIYNMLKQAAVERPEISKHIVTGSGQGPAISQEEILGTLRQITLQSRTNAETGYQELSTEEQSLAEKIQSATNLQNQNLDSETQNAISLLSMMFDRLQQEEQISDPIKPLLNELQIPILKHAIKDQGFFSNPDNAAQELVNEIAKAGTHWTPKENVSRDPFYRKISSIVREISEADEDTELLFEEKLDTLKEFLEKEERRAAILEERIIKAEYARVRTESARGIAENIIDDRLKKAPSKLCAAAFLKGYWVQVLFFFINRDDEDGSDEQDHAIELINTLLIDENSHLDIDQLFNELNSHLDIVGLQVADKELTFQHLRNELEKTQQAARAAMALAAESDATIEKSVTEKPAEDALEINRFSEDFPQMIPETEPLKTTATEIKKSVQAHDENTIAFEGFSREAVKKSSGNPSEPSKPLSQIIQPSDLNEDDYDRQAASLRANTWLKMNKEADTTIKIKLAAVIKHNGSYIFVNREGIKVVTTDKPGVASRLRSGEMVVLDDAVFFDRALESVIHSLRR